MTTIDDVRLAFNVRALADNVPFQSDCIGGAVCLAHKDLLALLASGQYMGVAAQKSGTC